MKKPSLKLVADQENILIYLLFFYIALYAGKNNQQGSQGGMSDQFEIREDAAGNIISNKSSEQTTFLTPNQDAIKALIGNPTPERINQFVELYGQNNLPDILKENK